MHPGSFLPSTRLTDSTTDPLHDIAGRSAETIATSEALLRRLDAGIRDTTRQIRLSRMVVERARDVLDDLVPSTTLPAPLWELRGHSPHPLACRVQPLSRGGYRVTVMRNGISMITEQFREENDAVVRGVQLGIDLVRLGWARDDTEAV